MTTTADVARAESGSIRLFCVDLNGTLLGNPEYTREFTAAWDRLPAANRPLLVYTCGRGVAEIQRVTTECALPKPAGIIGGLGTEVHFEGRAKETSEYCRQFQSSWKAADLLKMLSGVAGLVSDEPSFLHPYPLAWRWRNADPAELRKVEQRLADAGIEGRLVYAENRHVEIIPARTSKGLALDWLCSLLALPREAVLVAGDTLHDASMMLMPRVKRIVVENSLPDLLAELVGLEKFHAPGVMAAGVLQGLRHFGVLPHHGRV
jgi:hydroxymethylpyrimidine pyrophosphatase-like HAD family hydrolase